MKDSRTLTVEVGPVVSTVEGPAPTRELFETFAVWERGPGREVFPCYRPDGTFYTGLLREVVEFLEKRGYGVSVRDRRVRPPRTREWTIRGVEPRSYQLRVAEMLDENPLAMVRLPSAAGKSLAAMAALRRTGVGRAIYLTDRLDLVFQFAEAARAHLGIEPGFVGAGRFAPDGPLVVAGVDTALSRPEGLGRFDMAVADEAHAAAAPSYFSLLEGLGTHYRLGLTATPFRSRPEEDLLLRSLFGPPVDAAGLDELEAGGFVARPRLRWVPVRSPALDLTLVWRDIEEAMVRSRERNLLIVREALRAVEEGRSALVLVRLVRHGEILQGLFREHGREVPFLTGETPAARRHEVLRDFREGGSGILIGTDVLAVGVDMPRLGTLVLACGQHARVPTLQKVGRVMRVSPGGACRVKLVVDFDDSALHPTLGRHSQARRRWMKEMLGVKEEGEPC